MHMHCPGAVVGYVLSRAVKRSTVKMDFRNLDSQHFDEAEGDLTGMDDEPARIPPTKHYPEDVFVGGGAAAEAEEPCDDGQSESGPGESESVCSLDAETQTQM